MEQKTLNQLTQKFQNLLFSDQFCGLCFECGEGICINAQLEIVTADWSHLRELRYVYTSVFHKSSEDLASEKICNTCIDQLIQSYTFIQNSKFTSKLLNGYMKDLYSKTAKLNTYFKDTEMKSNICIILERINDTGNLYETKRTNICERNFTTKNERQVKSKKIKLTVGQNEISKLTPSGQTNKSTLCTGQSQISILTHGPNERTKLTHVGPRQTETSKQTQAGQTEKSKPTYSVKVEWMQCIMCLEDIDNSQDHSCEFKCPECKEPSCKHFAYLIHYREQLLQYSVAKCLDCEFMCRKKETLINHVNNYHLDECSYVCDVCAQTFHSKFAIKSHISLSHVLVHSKTYKKEMKLLELNDRNPKFLCEICNIECASQRQLRAHNFKHKGRFLSCHVCRILVSEVIFEKHAESHRVVSCNKCNKSFSKITHQYHQKSHLDDVTCPTCKKYMTPSKLRQHSKSHTDSQITVKKSKPNIKCELCDYITWNNILLECHMNRYHLKIKPYVCHICSKNFVGKHLLKKHIKFHMTDRSVICAACGKRLANLDCLKIHLKLHTGERNYSCDICGERFRSASIRNVHRVRKHCEREAACPLCPSKFHTLVELRRHVIKIHWKRNSKFDPRQLEGLEKHYHLFHDGRRIRMGDHDIDFYMPCS